MSIFINNSGNSKDSVELTGTPTAPTASSGTNNNQIATTAFVQDAIQSSSSSVSSIGYHFELVNYLYNKQYFPVGYYSSSSSSRCVITYECGNSINIDRNTGKISINNPSYVTYGNTNGSEITTYGTLSGKYFKVYSVSTGYTGRQNCSRVLQDLSVVWYFPSDVSLVYNSDSQTYRGYGNIQYYTAKIIYDSNSYIPSWNIAKKYNFTTTSTSTNQVMADLSVDWFKIPLYASKVRIRLNFNDLNWQETPYSSSAYTATNVYISFKGLSTYTDNDVYYLMDDSSTFKSYRFNGGITITYESIFKMYDQYLDRFLYYFPQQGSLSVSSNKIEIPYIDPRPGSYFSIIFGGKSQSQMTVNCDIYLEYMI